MEGASPDTSALALFHFDGETVTREFIFESDITQQILDELDSVRITERTDWSLDDVTLPMFGLSIGAYDGTMIDAVWSNGYWITHDGRAYLFDFDFDRLQQNYNWRSRDSFPSFIHFPNARLFAQHDNEWDSRFLTPAPSIIPPEGITITLNSWDSDTVSVDITNHNDIEWMYGQHYELHVLLDGIWYGVPTDHGSWGFTDEGLIVQAGQSIEHIYHLQMFGDLHSGTYRLVAYGLYVEYTLPSSSNVMRVDDHDYDFEYEATLEHEHFDFYSIKGTADSMTGNRWDRMVEWRENAVSLAEQHRDSVIINMNPNENVIFLTFDDGPDPVNTVSVINTLKEYNVSGTFFFLGENMRRHPEVVQMAYDAGFPIGLHGYTHTSFQQLSEEEIIAELEKSNDLLESITGSRATKMRPPYGAVGSEEIEVIHNQNLLIYLWSLDTLDWAQTDANEILRNVKDYTRSGEIILMHAFGGQHLVPEILPEMIQFLLDEGFEIRALP